MMQELNTLLYFPDQSENVTKSEAEVRSTSKQSGEISASAYYVTAKLGLGAGAEHSTKTSVESKYSHEKIALLQRNIIKYKDFFAKLSEIPDGPTFLLLDDLYHIPRKDQAHLVDYFHRLAKGSNLWLKIGTIRHRSRWYVSGDPPMGMKLGDDADEIDLDVTLEKYDLTKRFLMRILDGLCTPADVTLGDILADGARDRLVLASGGVARDFLTIFRRSIDVARERLQGRGELNRGAKIGAEDVNLAAGEFDKFKREDFERDTLSIDRDKLLGVLSTLTKFCIDSINTNCFLLEKDKKGDFDYDVHELVDLKFLHQVRSRLTLRDNPGELFEAYMLDLSQYTGERKRRDLKLVEFWRDNAMDTLRKRSLVFSKV